MAQFKYNIKSKERNIWPLVFIAVVIVYGLFFGFYIPSVASSTEGSNFYLKLISIIVGITVFFFIFLGHLHKALHLSLYISIFLISQTGMSYFLNIGETRFMTSALELHLILVFFLLFIKGATQPNRLREKTLLDMPIKCFLFTGVIGILSGFLYKVRPENIFAMAKPYYIFIILYYLALAVIKDEKTLKRFVNFFLICCLYPFYVATIESIKYFLTGDFIMRLSPLYAPHNLFSAIMMLIFFLLLSLFLFEKFWKKWIILPFLMIGFFNILFIQTRGVWLGFVVAFSFFVFIHNAKMRIGVVILGFFLCILIIKTTQLDYDELFETAISGRMHTVESRIVKASHAIAMVKAHPILGMGWGAYYVATPQGGLKQFDNLLPRWHNEFLTIASCTGIIGLLAFLWIWGKLLWNSFVRIMRNSKNNSSYLWAIQTGVFSGIIGVVAAAPTGQYFYRGESAAYIWFLVGILVASLKISYYHENTPDHL